MILRYIVIIRFLSAPVNLRKMTISKNLKNIKDKQLYLQDNINFSVLKIQSNIEGLTLIRILD